MSKVNTPIKFEKSFNGFKYLKDEKLDVLLPLSSIENGQMTKVFDVPCFYKPMTDKFVFFLPSSFLKEINIKELLNGNKESVLNNFERFGVHTEKDDSSYVYFSFDSLNELRESITNELSVVNKFKKSYEDYQLDIKTGEKVIFVAFKNTSGVKLSKNAFYSKGLDLLEKNDIVLGTHSKFECFQAYKFNDRYYLVNEDQSIDQKASFNIKKNQELELNYLIMPYTDKDWEMCNGINKKILEFKDKLYNLFSNQHTDELLDKPLSESVNPLLLDVLNTMKKPKI